MEDSYVETKVEALEGNRAKVTITLDAKDVDARIKNTYKEFANKYNFPGFRKGKAPRPVIDSTLGAQFALANATEAVVNEAAPAILNELDIVPVKDGDFKVEEIVKDGEEYTFSVEYALRPTPELSSYEPVAIEMPPAEVTESEIDAQVEMLMGYQTRFEDVEDRGIDAEDFITLSVKDVKGAEKLAGDDRMFAMGSGVLPEAVEEALKGMKVDEVKEISWTPEAEGDEEPEEASAEFTVKNIKARVVPELTDELAKSDAIKIEIEQDKASRLPQLKENRCVAKLAERLELEEMDADYEQSVFQELGQTFLNNLAQRGMSLDQWLQASQITSDQFIADLHRQANDVARESLALDALARELKVEVTDEDVDKEFENAGVEDVEASKASFIAEGRMPAIRDSIRRSKACDWLVENAQVTEVDESAKQDEGDTADDSEGAAE